MILALVAMALLASGCAPGAGASRAREIELAPISSLPPELAGVAPRIQEAYRFALANREILRQIPCYCGCGQVGHASNLDCYVQQVNPDGSVVFDRHSLF